MREEVKLDGLMPTVENMDKNLDTTCDYPAAHSMDTYWFAVDSEGGVAAFDTNEPGAVPVCAEPHHSDGYYDLLDLLAEQQSIEYQIRDVLELPGEVARVPFSGYSYRFVFLVAPSEDALDQLLRMRDVKRLNTPLAYVAYKPYEAQMPISETMTDLKIETLVKRGLIIKRWYAPFELHRFGISLFECEDYLIGEPYVRVASPPQVGTTFTELPPQVQPWFLSVQLRDIRFSYDEEVWIRRYFACREYSRFSVNDR